MLELPNVTLLAIDVVTPWKTMSMMRFSMRWVKFANAVCLTNTKIHREVISQFKSEVECRHVEQSSLKVSPPGMPKLRVPVDYELSVLRDTPKHFSTSHVLYMEWDSAVLNPDAWDHEWLSYDFIGAPWQNHNDPGWPKCDESNNVGNGGFSLKSKQFCGAVSELSMKQPASDTSQLISDSWMCRTMRPKLESLGMRFAPASIAAKFSCENKIYTGQFGFHGKLTADINGWGGSFGKIRP